MTSVADRSADQMQNSLSNISHKQVINEPITPSPQRPLVHRRHFIYRSSLLSAVCMSAPLLSMEPLARSGPSVLRLSLAAYSLRKYLQQSEDQQPKMDLFQFVDFCHDNGLGGAELTSYYFPEAVNRDYLQQLKRHCHVRGVTISGGAIRNDYCQLNPVALAHDLEHTRQWIDNYADLGAPVIRIFAGQPVEGEEPSQTLARCAKICDLACSYAQQRGVLLALENHGGVTARAEGLLEIVEQVQSPAFGVNFDSGNFLASSDPYAELSRIAPYAINAQIKVEIEVDGHKQPTDLPRVVQILRDAGYSGWLALEYEGADEPLTAIPTVLKQLQPLLDG